MLVRAIGKCEQGGDKHGTEFNAPIKAIAGDDSFKDGADEEIKP